MNTWKITTDDTLRETVRHGDGSYPFAYYLEDIWLYDFHRVDWHWHHELEFMLVTQGCPRCLIGTDKFDLPEGCAVFINSGILHRFESSGTAIVPNIVFSPALLAPETSLIYEKYVRPVTKSSAAYQIFSPEVLWQKQVIEILSKIFSLQESGTSDELQTLRLLLQMWEILFRHTEISAGSSDVRHVSHQQARLQTMMQFIHDHYAKAITLEKIADAASISKSGALHIFQSCIHVSPVAYLIQYRLVQAADLLHTTEKTVSAVASEVGFSDAGYFCRKFRQSYGVSPLEYRRGKRLVS